MSRRVRVFAAVCAMALLFVAGCSSAKKESAKPKVSPPAIGTEGVLRAGVDMSYPPFAGTDNGRKAGLDIDVASALAGKLGLKVELVDVKPSEAATALASGKADVVLSAPLTAETLSGASVAGTYLADGPAFFVAVEGTASVEPSLTLDTLGSEPVAVQNESLAHWTIVREAGYPEAVKTFDTLRDAFTALEAGEVKLVAGDAFVGAYMARDMKLVRYAGQAGFATPLGVAVKPENTALSDAVREALDGMAADGVLDTIRRKWVGDLPKLEVAGTDGADDQETEGDAPAAP